MRRLWCQLAVSYALLAFCAMIILVVMIYGFHGYSDFQAAISSEKVEKKLQDEQIILLHAINSPGNFEWVEKARDNVRQALMSLGEDNDGLAAYRITNSSRPEIYLRIYDKNNELIIADPAGFSNEIESVFSEKTASFGAEKSVNIMDKDSYVWVSMPVLNEHEDIVGYLRVLFGAKFSIVLQLKSVLYFLIHVVDDLIILSIPIGIVCGLVASRYVTKQLQIMNEVTESWRHGNFEPRIALPSDDVLIRHSQHLNDMARDLERYLGLKEDLAVSDERNRVARELHDTVKQKLFALGLQLAAAKAKPAAAETFREHILEAEIITRDAQHDVMEIITQLRPTGTGDASFYDRIGMIADDFRRRFGVDIELNHSQLTAINAYAEHHVLRIIQESVMNAVRHGKASKIVIESRIDSNTAEVTISDNGSGFDPETETTGFGLISMRDRMRDLDCGTFDVKSAAQMGTRISLSWKNMA